MRGGKFPHIFFFFLKASLIDVGNYFWMVTLLISYDAIDTLKCLQSLNFKNTLQTNVLMDNHRFHGRSSVT